MEENGGKCCCISSRGGDVAQFVEHRTSTPLTQVRFPGAARDFSPRFSFQCRLSYGVRTPPYAIVCTNTCAHPCSGELRTQKLKSHLVRTQSLNVLLFKPGVGQYIAIHATLTTRAFFLAYFYPSSPFTCIFSKPLPIFSSPDVILCG